MRGPRFAAALLVVATLLVGTQLAFTAVGQTVGPDWSDPAVVASVDADDSALTGVAADGRAVAWTERHGDRHTVHVARFEATDGRVTVRDRRRVASADDELTGVDVAATADGAVVVWEATATDSVRLARVTTDGTETRTALDLHRLGHPSVAVTDAGPLVAATGTRETASDHAVYVARPGGDPVRVGGPTHGQHAPTVTGGAAPAVTWYRTANDSVVVSRVAGEGAPEVRDSTVAARAKRAGEFGGARRVVPWVSSARDGATVRPVWTDVGVGVTAAVADGRVGQPTEVGPATDPDVAVADGEWVSAWTVRGGSTGRDVRYRTSDGERGAAARFPGEDRDPTPVFAPDPALVWYSWGSADEVLVSAHRPPPRNEVRYRLETGAPRFAFVSVVSGLLGVASLPVMPWTVAGMVGAFAVTSGRVTDRLFARRESLRERLRSLPATAWMVAFAAAEIPLTAYALRWVSFGFGHAVGTGLAALAAALVVVRLLRVDSPWRAVGVYVVLQNAAMWSLVAPGFL